MRVVFTNKDLADDAGQLVDMLDLLTEILAQFPRNEDVTLSRTAVSGLVHVLLLSSSTIEDLVESQHKLTAMEILAKADEIIMGKRDATQKAQNLNREKRRTVDG